MKNLMMRLWQEDDGQDLVEYVLLLTFLSLVVITATGAIPTAVSGMISNAGTQITTAS